MRFKRLCGVALATVFTATACISGSTIDSSATNYLDKLPYTLYMQTDRNIVSASEVANGDAVVHCSVYIDGLSTNKFSSGSARWLSDSDHVYFANMTTGDNGDKAETETTYNTSRGTFTTNAHPYCFGTVVREKYSTGSPMITTTEYACDPIFGASLYADGNGGIYFDYVYSVWDDTDSDGVYDTKVQTNVPKHQTCDVTVDENGTGHYTYEYITPGTNVTATKTVDLPRYDSTLPAGSLIAGNCNSLVWVAGSSYITSGLSFFGDDSDEFPFFEFDIVIEQGTPCGLYNVDFSSVVDKITGDPIMLTSPDSGNADYNIYTQGTTIAVGLESATVTDSDMNAVQYYQSKDTKKIKAQDFANSITANLTFSDGTTQKADITKMVGCSKASPKDLYDTSTKKTYFISDVPLTIDNLVVKNQNGSDFTQHIMVGLRGDADLDGTVGVSDAFNILQHSSAISAGINDHNLYNGSINDTYIQNFTFWLADTDTRSRVGTLLGASMNVTDAFNVLNYTTNVSAGKSVNWDECVIDKG